MNKSLVCILVLSLSALSLTNIFSSCSKSNTSTPDWEWEENQVSNADKPRYIWIDASANFPDFANNKGNITRDLAIAKNAGFTDIIVDVRPTTGDVLFNTDVADKVKYLGAWTSVGYMRIDRTETWDYLQAFIDEGHKIGLKVHAAINTFTGGNTTSLGSEGVVFRDNIKKSWTTDLNLPEGITNIMQSDKSAKFFNPVRTEVQDYLCDILEDLASYKDLDGIFLDRGRFDGFESDFSTYTKQKFEAYIGTTVTSFPNDIIPPGTKVGQLPSPLPKYFKQWLEFRAKTIHDFIVKARTRVKNVNPDVKFGVYVGGWYSSYYDVGVNWASPRYNTASVYSWASANYKDFGYADHCDQMLIGAYATADRVYGSTEWTMQGFCIKAKAVTMGDVKIAGGPDGNYFYSSAVPAGTDVATAIANSVDACINACDGYFFFDMIHLKQNNQWQYVKAGIDAAIASKK
ncbi:MAG: alpha amylase family protein [Rikenellaceae bacterium]